MSSRIQRLIFEFEVSPHEPDASFDVLRSLAWACGAGDEPNPPTGTRPIQALPRRMWLEGYEVETEITFVTEGDDD